MQPMVVPQVASTKPQWRPPVGTIYVFDPSPLNWLFITWNTMEEPIRVDQDGRVVNALATDTRWPDDHTLELDVRRDVRFQDREPFTLTEGYSSINQRVVIMNTNPFASTGIIESEDRSPRLVLEANRGQLHSSTNFPFFPERGQFGP